MNLPVEKAYIFAQSGQFSESFGILRRFLETSRFSEADPRVLKILRAYGQSLADLGLSATSPFFVLLSKFLTELGTKLTVGTSSEVMLLVVFLWSLIPQSPHSQAQLQLITEKFGLKTAASPSHRPEVALIDQWNRSILEGKLEVSFDCNHPMVGQTAAVGGSGGVAQDLYRLAKFNLIMDQKEPMNWLVLVKTLIYHGKLEIAEHL